MRAISAPSWGMFDLQAPSHGLTLFLGALGLRWQQKILSRRDPGPPNTLAPRIFLGSVHILAKVNKTNP